MQTAALSPAANPALTPNLAPNLAPAAAAGGLPGAPGGGADSFSRLLEAADARRQNEKADSPAPASAPAQPTRPATPSPQRAAAQPAPPARPSKPSEDAPEQTGTAQAAAAAPEETAAEAGSDATTPADAAALLASLGLTLRPQTAQDTARGRSTAASEARDGSASDLPTAAGATAAGRRVGGAAATADDEGSRTGQAFAGLLAQAAGAEADTAAGAGAASTQALATSATASTELRPAEGSALLMVATGALGPTAQPGSSAANPAEARLGQAPGSPAFADELGAQISTFVREGVQHAKLQLNPLELGPVTVQIQLDGGSAHMSFAAEHAQTRQALEQALPTLASSLREAGLTLSGGGVFEQPRQAQPETGADKGAGGGNGRSGERGGPGTDGGAAAGPVAARRRGVVDLVA
jgi:flagellar hook-length control protein FliK